MAIEPPKRRQESISDLFQTLMEHIKRLDERTSENYKRIQGIYERLRAIEEKRTT